MVVAGDDVLVAAGAADAGLGAVDHRQADALVGHGGARLGVAGGVQPEPVALDRRLVGAVHADLQVGEAVDDQAADDRPVGVAQVQAPGAQEADRVGGDGAGGAGLGVLVRGDGLALGGGAGLPSGTFEPSSSIIGPVAWPIPAWVKPSIVTCCVIAGSTVAGAIRRPIGRLNAIVSGPGLSWRSGSRRAACTGRRRCRSDRRSGSCRLRLRRR